MVLDFIFDPIFMPLINWNPFWGIIIISFLISLVITLAYKYFTDQDKMKRLKERQKDFQKRMKALRSKPEEMMAVQKEAMKVNMEYMKSSFKPSLITMIPILIIISWMAGALTYEPIFPQETYSITATFVEGIPGPAQLQADEQTTLINGAEQELNNNQATWTLKSQEGVHDLTVKIGEVERTKKVLITKELRYEEPLEEYEKSDIKSIQVNHNELKPLGSTSLFGWRPGWLGIYIISSVIFSMLLRKLMKLH